jgi:hypothetical protein
MEYIQKHGARIISEPCFCFGNHAASTSWETLEKSFEASYTSRNHGDIINIRAWICWTFRYAGTADQLQLYIYNEHNVIKMSYIVKSCLDAPALDLSGMWRVALMHLHLTCQLMIARMLAQERCWPLAAYTFNRPVLCNRNRNKQQKEIIPTTRCSQCFTWHMFYLSFLLGK